jgi:hypothetical protein
MAKFQSFGQVGNSKTDDQVIIDALDLGGASGYWLRATRVSRSGKALNSAITFVPETIDLSLKFVDIASDKDGIIAQVATANGLLGIIRNPRKDAVDIYYSSGAELDPTGLVRRDGTTTLTGNWDIGDAKKILANEISARNTAGLKLFEDGGKGIFVKDGFGFTGINNINPSFLLHISAKAAGNETVLAINNPFATEPEFDVIRLLKSGENGGIDILDADESENIKLRAVGNSYFIGGNVGIGTVSPGTSIILELSSTTKAFVPTKMTKTQRDAIASKVAGMLIYQTDNTPGLRTYNGSNWMRYTETID